MSLEIETNFVRYIYFLQDPLTMFPWMKKFQLKIKFAEVSRRAHSLVILFMFTQSSLIAPKLFQKDLW